MLALDHVTVVRGARRLLDDVSLELGPGLHALTGPNGGGKTTLLRLFAGLARPDAGRVRVLGDDARHRRPRDLARGVGYLPQRAHDAFLASTLAGEMRRTHGDGADALLARFGLKGLAERHPLTLSGGERRRAALALALAHDPRVLLLDEPTVGLDGGATDHLVDLLTARRDGACIVVATHDAVVIDAADVVLTLAGGRVRAAGRVEVP